MEIYEEKDGFVKCVMRKKALGLNSKMFSMFYQKSIFSDVDIASEFSENNPEEIFHGHKVILAAFSRFLRKKFIRSQPGDIILVENVSYKFLGYFFELVYYGKVLMASQDLDNFKAALRSLNVHFDDKPLMNFINDCEEDDADDSFLNDNNNTYG